MSGVRQKARPLVRRYEARNLGPRRALELTTDPAMNRPLQHISQGVCVSASVQATCQDGGGEERRLVCVAEETPIAFRYNGFAYAVMMATPDDLEDFAIGFSMTEGIIQPGCDLPELAILSCDDGISLDISLQGHDLHRYLATRRVRQLRGHTS